MSEDGFPIGHEVKVKLSKGVNYPDNDIWACVKILSHPYRRKDIGGVSDTGGSTGVLVSHSVYGQDVELLEGVFEKGWEIDHGAKFFSRLGCMLPLSIHRSSEEYPNLFPNINPVN